METEKSPFWKTCALTPQDQRNQRRALLWLFVWTVVWLAVSFGIEDGWLAAGALTMTAVVAATLFGIAMMLAYWRFVSQADELHRKIQLDALALGFGTGVVGTITYRLLEDAGAVSAADVADIAAIMMVAYAIGVVVGMRRYA